MKEIDEYLKKVKFCLFGISSKEKEKILAELSADLTELANEKGFENAIKEFGNPKNLAMKYKRIYGYSKEFKAIFILIGVVLSFFTVPLENCMEWIIGSSIILVIAFTYLIYISINIGSNFGLLVGLFSGVARTFAFALMPFIIDILDIAVFLAVTLIMILAGFIPGYAMKSQEEIEEEI